MNLLKCIISCFIIVLALESCKRESPKVIKIKGSETMLPLFDKLVNNYKKNQVKKYKIELEGGGSQTGIEALKMGNCDIALSSKKIRPEDSIEVESKTGFKLMEFDIAFDEILIIVNKENKIDSINFKMLKSIYSGEIDNWKSLLGEDIPIQLFSKSKNSGSLSFFKNKIMEDKPLSQNIKVLENSKDIVAEVIKDKGAIGFVGGGHFSDLVKVLRVSKDSLSPYYEPSDKNVKAKYYPLIIPFRLYYLENKQNVILADMMKYLSSKSARYLIIDEGYIPAIDK